MSAHGLDRVPPSGWRRNHSNEVKEMSNETLTGGELQDLAGQINAAHRAAVGLAASAVEQAMLAGNLLLQAKGKVPHGEWLPWLQEHCEVSVRSAQGYMRLALKVPELDVDIRNGVALLPLREALGLMAEPREAPAPDEDSLPALLDFWLTEIDEANRRAGRIYERLYDDSMPPHEAIVYFGRGRWAAEMVEAHASLVVTINRALDALGGVETVEEIIKLCGRRLRQLGGVLADEDEAARFSRLGLSEPFYWMKPGRAGAFAG